MSASLKYKNYTTEVDEKSSHQTQVHKKAIHVLKTKIMTELSEDVAKQKKAALILEKLINSK
jgi:hypothetical protein